MLNKVLIVFCVIFISSCVMDCRIGIVTISNNTNYPVVIAIDREPNITDSLVFLDQFQEDSFVAREMRDISIPTRGLKGTPDSDKIYFHVFSKDSLIKYRSLKKVNGIIKSSLIKKFSIQLNKVTDKLDTVNVLD